MASDSAKTSAALMRSLGGAKSASLKSSGAGGATLGAAQAASIANAMKAPLRMDGEIVCLTHVSPQCPQGATSRRQARARLLDGARRTGGDRGARALRF